MATTIAPKRPREKVVPVIEGRSGRAAAYWNKDKLNAE